MADVVIVGGGIIGVSIAYYLSLEKIKVLVLEKEGVGRQASSGAVGFMTVDPVPFKHESLLAAGLKSREMLLELSKVFKEKYGVDIEVELCGSLRLAKTEDDLASLEDDARWEEKKVAPVEKLTPREIRRRWPAIEGETAGGFFYPADFQLTSSRLVEAFRQAAAAEGATFVEYKGVVSWQAKGGKITGVVTGTMKKFSAGESPLNPDPRTSPDGSPHVLAGPLSTTGFKGDSPALNASIAADKFVLAAGPWSGELARLLGFQVPVYPARGQILIFEMKERFLSCPVLMGKDHVYYYLGPKPDGHLYAGTTVEDAGFDTKCTDEALERIGEETAAFVPRVNTLPIRGSWAGLRPATRDNLPIIGRAPGWDNLYVATGHFRKGILLSAVTGKIMADLVLGRKPPLSIEEFSVDRFAAAKGARHVF